MTLADALLGAGHELGRSQWWCPEELRAHQVRLLGPLLEHARRAVPFYPQRDGFPVLTRREVQEHADELAARKLPRGHGGVTVAVSGGSSGVPVRVRQTTVHQLMVQALQVRDETWHRRNPTGRMVRLRRTPSGLTAEQEALARSPAGLEWPNYGPPTSLLWPTGTVWIQDDRVAVADQAALLDRVRPAYLFTFPSNLRLLFAHLRGCRAPKLESVWTMSEVVDAELRERCREVFGCKIVDSYSCAEAGYLALQCPEREHFHVQSEGVLLEVLDDEGRQCGPGEVGRVVVTPLHNYAMPLIRYELGDRAEVGEPCPCGRGLPVLKRVVGRMADYVVGADGARRPVDQGFYKLAAIEPVREFQIVQRSAASIEARLVTSRALNERERDEVFAVLEREFGAGFMFSISPRERIERTEAGKVRPFVSEVAA